jgi:aldehyde:ferredoxin oxidoreductase
VASFSRGTESESTNGFGYKCLALRWKVVLKLNEMCHGLGRDTVEIVNMFVVLMEWHEKGIIDKDLKNNLLHSTSKCNARGKDLSWGFKV